MNTIISKSKALRGLALVSAVTLAGGWGVGFAQQDTDSFTVSATVAESCHIDSTQDIVLGEYDPFNGGSSSGVLEIRCTNGTGYNIGLDSTGELTHSNESDTISYGLFQDGGHGTVWNDTSMVSDTGNGVAQSHTVYVNVPADATAPVGVYSELVTVTVDFTD